MEANSRPCILVIKKQVNNLILKELLAGIEEEGIPYNVGSSKENDILKETYKAAQASRMGIGIGIDENRIVLHYNKLKQGKPIVDEKLETCEKKKIRKIGNNAARLYKIMPLKDINTAEKKELIDRIKESVIASLYSDIK